MTAWVALLRGVNVGGGNRLPMASLRTSVASLGYADVATYIQSGNVVFRTDEPESVIVERLRALLAERHGLSVPVVARTGEELTDAVDRHPFTDIGIEPKLLHVAFLDREPDLSDGPHPDRWLPDGWAIEGRELFLAYPAGSGRSKMTIEQFERPWRVTATARNLNTVVKLAAMAAEMS
jgi:uncharacterized protein (DUF1697 family)